MKYFHELSEIEIIELKLKKGYNFGNLNNDYKQPDWCEYPDALIDGCWTLLAPIKYDQANRITKEFCSTCDCFKKSKIK